MLKILQEMHKLDFKIISHEVAVRVSFKLYVKTLIQVNMVTGADKSGYYNFVEVVFMR